MNEGLGLGVDLVGLSSTGVFVNKLYPGGVAHQSDKLQIGDQVLEVNNQNTGKSSCLLREREREREREGGREGGGEGGRGGREGGRETDYYYSDHSYRYT